MTTVEGFQPKEEVDEYLYNIGIEYRFQCFSEKRPDGCHRLGEYMEQIKRDFDKAATVYQSACDQYKYPRSCFKIGNYKLIGKGCSPDLEDSIKYHKLACEGGHPVGCYQVGVLRQFGYNGAGKNLEEAKEYYRLGCEKEDGQSCFGLGTIYLDPHTKDLPSSPEDDRNAFKYSKAGCDLNHIYACANLHQLYTKGIGCDVNEDLAAKAKKKALALRDMYERNDPGVVYGEG